MEPHRQHLPLLSKVRASIKTRAAAQIVRRPLFLFGRCVFCCQIVETIELRCHLPQQLCLRSVLQTVLQCRKDAEHLVCKSQLFSYMSKNVFYCRVMGSRNGKQAVFIAGYVHSPMHQPILPVLWSKLWSNPNEVSPQTKKNPTISNVKSLDFWSSRAEQIRTFFLR